jgi:hypothetical protein
MFLFAITLGAILVFATPHALHHHALHRRTFAARVASNSSDIAVKRQDSSDSDCIKTSSAPSADTGIDQNTPDATTSTRSPTSPPPPPPTTTTTSSDPADTDVVQNTPHTTPTHSPTSPLQKHPPATTSIAAAQPPVAFISKNVKGPHKGQGTFYKSLSISPSCFSPF